MYKIIFIFLGLFFTSTLNAQQVTFNDLIKMNAETASNATQYLPQKKKWVEKLEATSNDDSAVVILKTEFKKLEKSNHWVSIYSENDKPKSISYQTTKKMYVDKIVIDLKEAGFTLSGSKISDRSRSLTYSKDNINIEVMTVTDETTPGVVYLVTLNS
jgi:hypothetical protein